MSETPLNQDQNSDEIDLKDLVISIWKFRKHILIIGIICSILGGIIGFLTPTTYTATSTFLPQKAETIGMAGNLGSLAALAGINLNAQMSGGDIPPSMYFTVLESEPFRKRVLDAIILNNEDSLSYRDYLKTKDRPLLSSLFDYIIQIQKEITGIDLRQNEPIRAGELIALTKEENKLHKALSEKISITSDKKEGIVSLKIVEEDPLTAAQVAKATEEILQDWIIEHKIKYAKAQYDFIEKQFDAKQKEFFSIQEQLANYTDRNQNVLSASYLTRLDRLQAEFDLLNTVYTELAKQKEQAAIQLSKDTPTFSVLDPVKVPNEKTGPKNSIYILSGFFIGVFFSSGWFIARKSIKNFLIEIRINS
jgi:uncharacterized protein involved in exopolysaccharide biosynthesis